MFGGQNKLTFVNCSTVAEMLADPQGNVLVIDVRDADRSSGWIPQSVNIPSMTFSPEALKEAVVAHFGGIALHAPPTIIFHCQFSQCRGPTAASTAQQAIEHGLFNDCGILPPNVAVLSGGFIGWASHFRSTRPDLIDGSYH